MTVLLVTGSADAAEPEKPEEPAAAVVNGVRIPMSVLDREIQITMAQNPQLRSSNDIAALRKVRKEALDDVINKELIIQEGKKAGIEARELEIDTELAKIKQRFTSEAEYQKALKQQKFTEEKLREVIARALISKKVLDIKIKPTAKPVTDGDIEAYYQKNKDLFQEVQASHILIKVASDADDQAKADAKSKMQTILAEANGGADFAELAKEHSQCPSSLKGGDLGFFRRGQMVEPFEDAAFSLETGQISEIVETQFGYHIILAVDKKPKTQSEIDEIHEKIRKILFEKEVDAALRKWLGTAREEATIEVLFKG
jgi:peptidyl-prolyl cis-trans isomerase C